MIYDIKFNRRLNNIKINNLFLMSINLYVDTCHFQKLLEENTAPTEFDFNWNSVPAAIGKILFYSLIF